MADRDKSDHLSFYCQRNGGGLEFFEGSHGFQENGEGLCQSQTDLKRHRKKIECLFFFPIHPHSLLQNLATHATFPRQGSIIQSQLVECGKDVFNLIFHLNKLHCRVAIKETCCSAKCQTFILPILLYKLRAIMKCITSCRSHEYGYQIPRPTQDFQSPQFVFHRCFLVWMKDNND